MKINTRFKFAFSLVLCLIALTAAAPAQTAVPATSSAPTVQAVSAPLPGSNVAPGSTVDPYSILTSDPAVGRAIAYLETLGAPVPVKADTVETYPGGSYILSTLTFTNTQTGAASTVIAGLAAMFPNVAANDLARDGVITLTTLLFNVPVPGVNISTGTSSTNSPSPLAVPQSPLGPKMSSGTSDAIGDNYYDSPFDTFPLGHVYTDPATGHQFTKMGSLSPFGILGAHWQRTA